MRNSNIVSDLRRFIGFGLANTLLTLLAYELLLFWLGPSAAYSIAWVIGLVAVGIFVPNIVFVGGRKGLGDRATVMMVYGLVFVLGLTTVAVAVEAGCPARLAVFAALIVTATANFALSRLLLRRGNGLSRQK